MERHTSTPSMSGRPRSRMMRSGRSRSATAIASRPVAASKIRSASCSSAVRTIARIFGSSSTTRTMWMIMEPSFHPSVNSMKIPGVGFRPAIKLTDPHAAGTIKGSGSGYILEGTGAGAGIGYPCRWVLESLQICCRIELTRRNEVVKLVPCSPFRETDSGASVHFWASGRPVLSEGHLSFLRNALSTGRIRLVGVDTCSPILREVREAPSVRFRRIRPDPRAGLQVLLRVA